MKKYLRYSTFVFFFLLLMTAAGPRANATGLLAYYDFEGAATPPFPVNATSHAPAFFDGSDPQHTSTLIDGSILPIMSVEAGIPINQIGANTTGLGFRGTAGANATLDIPLVSSLGFRDMTLSFGLAAFGNGYTSVTLFYSTSGIGGPFTQVATFLLPPTNPGLLVPFDVPAAANNAPNLVLRIQFNGGQSTGLNLQNVIDNIQVNGTIPQTATVGQFVISEFRVRGPNGANDEFIEIYNASGADHTVAGVGGGYGVAASDGTTRCSIPNGTVIPNRGHYLCVNSVGYSLASYPAGNGTTATGDGTYTLDIPDNSGIALFNNNTGGSSYSLANRLDAVGSTVEANTLYKEGTGYPALTPFSLSGAEYLGIDHSWVRDSCGKNGSIATMGVCPSGGNVVDTNNNSADFIFVDTNGTSAGGGQRLGAPGPENLAGPIERNLTVPASLVFPCLGASSAPNRVRDFTSDPANNSTFGTIEVRRTFTNNTGSPLTRLRFRVIDISTFPAPSGIADLRPRTSVLTSVANPCGGPAVTLEGTTLETPPSQPNGGGFNSSFGVSTVTTAPVIGSGKSRRGSVNTAIERPDPVETIHLDVPLPAGGIINIRFLLGIQQTGNFKFYVNVEVLP